jgi:hypothetical protein
LLDKSFVEDPLDTLKLVAYIRDCRGGKGERQLRRFALEYLAQTHPREVDLSVVHSAPASKLKRAAHVSMHGAEDVESATSDGIAERRESMLVSAKCNWEMSFSADDNMVSAGSLHIHKLMSDGVQDHLY